MQLNTNDRDALLRLCQRATEVAAWAEPRDPWERSRIESALQELGEELLQDDAPIRGLGSSGTKNQRKA